MRKTQKTKKLFLSITAAFAAFCMLCAAVGLALSAYVRHSTKERVLSAWEAAGMSFDCILVLGCGVNADGTPSDMLTDRLLQGIELFKLGAAPKMLMSGDHGTAQYDEVNTMKSFAIERGVPSQAIFMDHAGFSTYESMYRAAEIFKAERIVIVTQDYHLYRAIYDAGHLGLEAYGVASNPRKYFGQAYRDLREILARDKDVIFCIFKPKPTYLGEPIPVFGNGDVTNDK